MRRHMLLALTVLAAFPATATAQEHDPVIPPGVTAGGTDVGNLTLTQAAALLEQRFGHAMGKPLEVRVAGRGFRTGMKRLEYAFDALKTARRANIAGQEANGAPVDVPLHVTYDDNELAVFSSKVKRRSRIRARNAKLRITLRRLIRRNAKVGWAVNAKALQQQIATVLQDPGAYRVIRARRERVHPKVNFADLKRQYGTVLTIDRSGFRLRLFKGLEFAKSYGIAVGLAEFPTPTGRYSITNKAVNPAWSAPDQPWAGAYRNEVVAGGSAENPLKARWLGITGGVGIHGTAAEYSIGTRASHGCIRMRVADVIDLYPRVPVGTAVLIR